MNWFSRASDLKAGLAHGESWKLYVMFGFVGVLILLIIFHLIGGGFPHH